MQIAASIAVVRAAYAAPPVPRTAPPPVALPSGPAAAPADQWKRWPAAQEPAGLPAGDWARYAPDAAELSRLTPNDRELLHAVTGQHISSDGTIRGPKGQTPDPLATAIAGDRVAAGTRWEVTTEYLADLASREGAPVIDPGHLDRAADFFAAREHRRAEDPHPRSSFTLHL